MSETLQAESFSNTGLRVYEAPVLERVGRFETHTRGGVDGNFTDMVFPAGTPRGDITFYDPTFS